MKKIAILSGLMLMLVLIGTASAKNQASSANTNTNTNTSPGTIVVGGTPYQGQDPFEQLREFQDEMEKVFKNMMGDQLARFPRNPRGGMLGSLTHSPDLDVIETEKEYLIDLDLPGMVKDQIDVEIAGNLLTISGERKREEHQKEKQKDGSSYSYSGRTFGAFSHSLELPEDANINKLSAEYESGVLSITIGKKTPGPAPKAKKIEVR